MIRVALQISGMQRYGAFFPDFLATLNRVYGPVDVYLHQWAGPYTAAALAQRCGGNPVMDLVIEEARAFEIDPRWRTPAGGTPVHNITSMCWGIHAVNEQRREKEARTAPYDLVIRARSDIRLIDFPSDPAWALDVPPGTIRIGVRPGYLAQWPVAVQDQIAFGRPADMDRYAELYQNLPAFYEENPANLYHPETYFGWSLRKSGLSFDETAFSLQLERAHLHPKNRASY